LTRQILSDYVITDAEYKQAQDRFVQCQADLGFTVTFNADGGYSQSAKDPKATPAEMSAADKACTDEGFAYIQQLYYEMRSNPNGLTNAELIRQCFTKAGVSDGAGLSDDQFSELVLDPNFKPSSAEAQLCILDPAGTQGVTLEQAEQYWSGH